MTYHGSWKRTQKLRSFTSFPLSVRIGSSNGSSPMWACGTITPKENLRLLWNMCRTRLRFWNGWSRTLYFKEGISKNTLIAALMRRRRKKTKKTQTRQYIRLARLKRGPLSPIVRLRNAIPNNSSTGLTISRHPQMPKFWKWSPISPPQKPAMSQRTTFSQG